MASVIATWKKKVSISLLICDATSYEPCLGAEQCTNQIAALTNDVYFVDSTRRTSFHWDQSRADGEVKMSGKLGMYMKNINAMDAYLSLHGYCRKALVRDGSCVFRAVSEKLFLTQSYHEHVGQMCAEYIWHHQDEFQDFSSRCSNFSDLPGIVDMMVLSKIYGLEFTVFHAAGMPPVNVTQKGSFNKILLVHVEGGHYDLVYTKAFVQSLALCQSIVYEVLYHGVFGLTDELDEAVSFLRMQKSKTSRENGNFPLDIEGRVVPFHGQKGTPERRSLYLQQGGERAVPPLPYRIAKALDPCVYRNVELDIIQEEKREIKLKLQSRGLYGVFCPGDKCQVHLEEGDNVSVCHAHVQEINEPNGPVVVYIEELGEKKTVPYSCLRPLPLAIPKTGLESQSLLVADIGPLAFGDKKGRRRKNILPNTMPGASEFQTLVHMGRSPRTPVGCNRQISEGVQKTAASTASQQAVTDCITLGDSMEMTAAQGYCMVATSALPITNQSHLAAQASSTVIGQGPSSSVVYWMPVVSVPYANTMGQVNLARPPSQDPYGKDLPHNDVNTLRYFFNLGVEYFRISASMQQQQTFAPASPMQQPLPNGSPLPMMLPVEQGQSFVAPEPVKPHNSKTNSGLHRPQESAKASTSSPSKGSVQVKGGAEEGLEKGENMDLSSDLSEVGCRSSGEEGSGEDDPEQHMEVGSNRTDDDAGSTQGEGEGGTEKGGKGKGRRKYYMYGCHKLIKPIKDIPPRFQMMLAENSAAKARCEGQPIYMQMSASELISYDQADGTSDLNADAQCFYPTQLYDTVTVDETGQCTYANGAVTFPTPASQPPPLLVPPPPVMPPPGCAAPVGLVYTTTPSTIASVMAPPLHTHTVTSAVPRPGDGKLVSVSTSTSPSMVAGQVHTSASSDKLHEEFTHSSTACRPHGKPESSASSHVSSCTVSNAAPSSLLHAPPFSAPTNLLPSLAPRSMHVAPSPPVSCAPGGGKQCFYLYPSPSAGFPSMPATPSQGQSHMPGPSPGQVVYVMNPQVYPPPPCTAYQSTMIPTSAHSVGLPCPAVAVQ